MRYGGLQLYPFGYNTYKPLLLKKMAVYFNKDFVIKIIYTKRQGVPFLANAFSFFTDATSQTWWPSAGFIQA